VLPRIRTYEGTDNPNTYACLALIATINSRLAGCHDSSVCALVIYEKTVLCLAIVLSRDDKIYRQLQQLLDVRLI